MILDIVSERLKQQSLVTSDQGQPLMLIRDVKEKAWISGRGLYTTGVIILDFLSKQNKDYLGLCLYKRQAAFYINNICHVWITRIVFVDKIIGAGSFVLEDLGIGP